MAPVATENTDCFSKPRPGLRFGEGSTIVFDAGVDAGLPEITRIAVNAVVMPPKAVRESAHRGRAGVDRLLSIAVKPDRVLLERGWSVAALSRRVGATEANLSILKTGKAKAICKELRCQPGDI